jgi:hypothetical protein
MKPKYFFAGFLAFSAMIAWNIFLVHRDDALYKAYYHHQAIENLKKPVSSEIK